MIEINLLPQDLKTKGKKTNLQLNYLLYLVPLLVVILVCIHIYFITLQIIKTQQFNSLNNKWQSLESQRRALEGFKKEHEILSAGDKLIQQLAAQRISWAKRLNKLSLYLPGGVWLNGLSFTLGKDFVLKGSAISLQKEEMSLINKFMDNLKNDAEFFKGFSTLELTSVERRTLGGYDIIDFVLTGH